MAGFSADTGLGYRKPGQAAGQSAPTNEAEREARFAVGKVRARVPATMDGRRYDGEPRTPHARNGRAVWEPRLPLRPFLASKG
ncbi:hypothetical protein [Streptomyces sp. x-80]|uniref:hypothetical protein n=1 Tax=Streptomyces sp. x-80 TaxID=2789282 RepID=UPI0039804D1C